MQATLAELATLVDGQIVGDGQLVICGAATLCDAAPGQITLVDQSEKNHRLENCRAAAVVAPRSFTPQDIPAIQVDDVHRAFALIVRHFCPPRLMPRIGVSPLAAVSPTAEIGPNVDIHPFATIGENVVIGAGSTTLKRADLQKSVEPDECYYFYDVRGPRETGQISLPDDPPPDLAVEVDLTSSSRIRQRIYARIGIAEVWRFAKDQLEMYRLQEDGSYLPIERSVVLPQLTASDLTRFLALHTTHNEAQILRQFRDWVRANFGA